MAFNGTEAKQVTKEEAAPWTANFRATITPGDTIGRFFGKDILNEILNQPGCMGIRIYNGINEEGNNNLVLVGADANEDDMVNGVIAQHSASSPPFSGIPNLLNS